jgi:DNA-binding NtrC family response regulator
MALNFIINHVVLIEDEEATRKELKQLLLTTGMALNVYDFTNGNEAIEFLKSVEYIDLVITDFCMPNGDGGDVINYILNHTYNEVGRHLPVLVVTGHDEVKAVKNKSGGLKILIKPITFEQLYKEIFTMINNQEIYLLKSSIREMQTILSKISKLFEHQFQEEKV